MLQSIHVKNMALIDEAEVSFGDQLNILTGETGAGKSIIIGSVSIALGGKVSKDIIRRGADYALTELNFKVKDPETLRALEAMDIPMDGDNITIARRIGASRSVARINGEMVSLSDLKAAAALLIDIHGQHEHQSLLKKEKHLEILDQYGRDKNDKLMPQIKEAYQNYTALQKELAGAVTDESRRQSEISFLEYQIMEIDEAALKPGEEEALDKAFTKMSHARQMLENVADAHAMTGYEGDRSAGDLIGRALHALFPIEKYDEGLTSLIAQLSDIDALLNDFNRELADYQDSLSFDEQTYNETEQRINLIQRLESKYGRTIDDVLAHREKCEKELDRLNHYETYLEDLKRRESDAEKTLARLSDQLTAIRKKDALVLQEKIRQALVDLNFLDVRFEICLEKLGHYSAGGQDTAEFRISTNPGEAIRPLSQVASGGELSRIMLAIKSVLADADAIETLIFDEIDTGISGRTAQKVSEKMAVIGRAHQVICITHLPQIASMADTHFVIEKKAENDRTFTEIRKLSDEESVGEIARLLGGAKITKAVLENAREMKALAGTVK